jgi:hypothetical protein
MGLDFENRNRNCGRRFNMNNKQINILIIIGLIIMMFVYILGVHTKNIISYSNSEIKNPDENLNSNIKIETEIPDLTTLIDYDNIIVDNELTIEDIIMCDCGLTVIDYVALIDSCEDNNWYCYYICSDGDCYAITIKNESVDVCCQLN